MDVADDKRRLRAEAKTRRAEAWRTDAEAPRRLAETFLAAVPVEPGDVVAGYWPIGEEIDVRPLLAALDARGVALCLPVVAGADAPLAFRAWRPGAALAPGAYGIAEPSAAAPAVRPSLVIVPLLAFDAKGWRLGYGAGYYDRTLAGLRAGGGVRAVGAAFAAQQVARVPHHAGDAPLDLVVTERAVVRCGGSD